MNTRFQTATEEEQLNVLIVGNNPLELSGLLERIGHIPGRILKTETAFDARSLFERLMRFKPNYILIDDNIGTHELNTAVQALAHSRKTKDIPVTLLKNSNYVEANSSPTIFDYILKKTLTAEALYASIRNSIKVRRTQLYLYKAYKKRTGLLMSFVK